MKLLFLTIPIVLFLGGVTRGQVVDPRQQQADEVRAMVEGFGLDQKVSLLTRSLVFRTGKVTIVREASFHLKFKSESSDKPILLEIKYEDVLELEAGGKWVSFVPDVTARNYGSLKDVGRIFGGTRILVVYADNKADLQYEIGFANSVSNTHLRMCDKKCQKTVDLPADQVRAVYGLVGGRAGVKSRLSKNDSSATDPVTAMLSGIATGVKKFAGMVEKDDAPILVFSR